MQVSEVYVGFARSARRLLPSEAFARSSRVVSHSQQLAQPMLAHVANSGTIAAGSVVSEFEWTVIAYCLLIIGGALFSLSEREGLPSMWNLPRSSTKKSALVSIALPIALGFLNHPDSKVICVISVFVLVPVGYGLSDYLKRGEKNVPAFFLLYTIAIAFVLFMAWYFWPVPRLRDAQLKELQAVDAFIARKDEMELRESFDFPNMIQYNVRLTRRSVFPQSVTPAQSADIENFFRGNRQAIAKYFSDVHEVGGRIEGTPIPGKMAILGISPKYIDSLRTLSEFCSSTELPQSVIAPLTEFKATVQSDMDWMFDSINDTLLNNPRSIIEIDDPQSTAPSASGRYWLHFKQLSPVADKVRIAIRNSLKNSQQ
jgi:hypothetical protein